MRIGYIHLGAPEHGVSRYGRLLAAEARRRADLQVLEREVILTGNARIDREHVASAARGLASADVIHLQYNNQLSGCVWGAGWRQLFHLALFARLARAPIVATIHDIYRREPPGLRWMATHAVSEARRAVRVAPRVAALRYVQRRASRIVVCTTEERGRLTAAGGRITVIPHFVEERRLTLPADAAKRALGLEGRRVVTLLGYIHPRKGHRLLFEALARLPADVTAICAGGFTEANAAYAEELRCLIQALGIEDRVRITGYLPDAALDVHLAATDLAVCPFKTLSASGSLSTWLASGRPILASDLPQIDEYRALEPDAISTFHPNEPGALAARVAALLDSPSDRACRAVGRLRDRLLIPAILDRHVAEYRAAVDSPRPRWRESDIEVAA